MGAGGTALTNSPSSAKTISGYLGPGSGRRNSAKRRRHPLCDVLGKGGPPEPHQKETQTTADCEPLPKITGPSPVKKPVTPKENQRQAERSRRKETTKSWPNAVRDSQRGACVLRGSVPRRDSLAATVRCQRPPAALGTAHLRRARARFGGWLPLGWHLGPRR